MTPDELLTRSLLRARRAQSGHFEAATQFQRMNVLLGMPVVVLSTIVGSSIFAALEKDTNEYFKIIAACLSLTSAVLAGMQTFLRYSEKAETHKAAATKYGELKRLIERLQTFPPANFDVEVKRITEVADKLSSESPLIPNKIWNKVNARVSTETQV